MQTIQAISNNPTYQQVLKDSFGGVMYNVANRGKYDTQEVLSLWESLTDQEKNSVGGIMKGAIDFLKETN